MGSLKIFFRGLCLVVPNRIGDNGAGLKETKSMTFLLANATHADNETDPLGRKLLAHEPLLIYKNENGDDEQKPLMFDDFEIKIDGVKLTDGPIVINKPARPCATSFDDIPKMIEIFPQDGGLNVTDDCLMDYGNGPLPGKLAARIRLKNGEIKDVVKEDLDGVFIDDFPLYICDFKRYVRGSSAGDTPEPTRENKKVGGHVLYTHPLASTNVTVTISSKRAGGPSIDLKPNANGDVELLFQNVPVDPSLIVDPKKEHDFDFSLAYKVAKEARDFRYPVKKGDDTCGTVVGESPVGPAPRPIMCAMAIYNENNNG